MAKSSVNKNVLKFKAGLYTATAQLTDELQKVHRRSENPDFSEIPSASISRLCDAVPELECVIARRRSEWSRKRVRTVPLAAFLPHLPCESHIAAEEALDQVFWEYGSDEVVSQQLCDGRAKVTDQSDDWRLCLQLEEPPDGTKSDWSISLWLQSVDDPSLRVPVSRESLEETWSEPAISLSAYRVAEKVRYALNLCFDLCPILHRFEEVSDVLSARTIPGHRRSPGPEISMDWIDPEDIF
jgi:hypothetical protein